MSGWSGMSSEDNQGSVLKLEASELKTLEALCNEENAVRNRAFELSGAWFKAMMDAREAEKERDKFCLGLERKYEIKKGARWNVDFDAGGIVVEPTVKPS